MTGGISGEHGSPGSWGCNNPLWHVGIGQFSIRVQIMRRLWSKLVVGALSNPSAAFAWASEEIRLNDNRRHRTRAGVTSRYAHSVSEFLDILEIPRRPGAQELKSYQDLYQQLVSRVNRLYGYAGSGRPPSVLAATDAEALYAIVVGTRPSIVVETGVSDGVSTATILSGLKQNGSGELYSIDYPDVGLPRLYGQEPGWVVPEELKSRWRFFPGRSVKLLSPLLGTLGGFDLFLHDSEHSYSNMSFELKLMVRSSVDGSVILADDAVANDAIYEARDMIAERTTGVAVLGGRFGGFRVRLSPGEPRRLS